MGFGSPRGSPYVSDVDQLNSKAYPLTIPARSTRTLSQLGVSTSRMPTIRMYNLKTNQNSCKRAVIGLKYVGVGRGGPK